MNFVALALLEACGGDDENAFWILAGMCENLELEVSVSELQAFAEPQVAMYLGASASAAYLWALEAVLVGSLDYDFHPLPPNAVLCFSTQCRVCGVRVSKDLISASSPLRGCYGAIALR